ncbi:hypothetical protein O3P69_020500 [Scylla paramamosain]|uniref:Uncharacterized protein n=1 Tax=Scylla paramamosain TaxID=85552 RepID=A0AAW0TMV7_SCYPA
MSSVVVVIERGVDRGSHPGALQVAAAKENYEDLGRTIKVRDNSSARRRPDPERRSQPGLALARTQPSLRFSPC